MPCIVDEHMVTVRMEKNGLELGSDGWIVERDLAGTVRIEPKKGRGVYLPQHLRYDLGAVTSIQMNVLIRSEFLRRSPKEHLIELYGVYRVE